MKDKTARALAITALVFMAVFVAALVATMIDYTLLNGSVGYIALCSGVFTLMIFLALKADGRGYSITKMNNEIEMQKIEKEAAEKEAAENVARETEATESKETEAAESKDDTETAGKEPSKTSES